MTEHWTDDTERVERYVLGTIPAEERSRLDAHLNGCSRCRNIVREEEELAGGIRAFGRSRMKEKVRLLLQEEPARVLPWPHIVSVAAVLLIAVGLSVVIPWGGTETPVVKDSDLTVQEGGETDETAEAADVRPREVPERQPEARVHPDRQDREEEGVAARTAPSVEMYDAAPVKQELQGEQWIVGHVLADRELRSAALEKRAEETPPRPAAGAKTLAGSEGARLSQRVSVTRQSVEMLPPEQSALLEAASVPAMVRQTPGLIELVVFADSVSAGEGPLRFEQVTGDSIVVFLNGSVVGYRIPQAPVQPVE